ncbi:PrsW family glutamic-type intramembrane protease [Lachnospiraceae bacterium 45-W7]
MGYTRFYGKLQQETADITWRDVFSEYKNKHTRKELEYALLAGTAWNSVTEADMLQKWKKPWVFYPLLRGGLGIVAVIYGLLMISLFTSHLTDAYIVMLTIIPPLVMPVILMIFIWELNIPRNLSVYELFLFFLLGGVASFFVTALMYEFVGNGPASLAAFREEPAKFAVSLLFLHLFSKKKKLYGLTGLVIGAAVGAGFGGFESIAYAQRMGGNLSAIIVNQILRGIFSLGGHVVFCAPYMGAIALNMSRSKAAVDCLLERDFMTTFAASTALHFLWNCSLPELGIPSNSPVLYMGKSILVIVLLWMELLYIAKKCLHQAVVLGMERQGNILAQTQRIRVECVTGVIRGAVWESEGNEILTIGRNANMVFQIPASLGTVSRRHCSIQRTYQGWTLRDLHSTCGTFVGKNQKLMPGLDYVLHSGEIIYLAGKENAFRVTFP